jgi:hypothetical protein
VLPSWSPRLTCSLRSGSKRDDRPALMVTG